MHGVDFSLANLNNDQFLADLLNSEGDLRKALFAKAAEVKQQILGNSVHFRGLVEFSNICIKDCLYCGIRKSNTQVHRYSVTDDEILAACKFAYENKMGSVVLQSGERTDTNFIEQIDRLIFEIKKLSNQKLGITLSCGEQSEDVYRQWFATGAHRYLLRIESSTESLYKQIHPNNNLHAFDRRLSCLQSIKQIGYQTGTGVMIGMPFQTTEHLVADLRFFQKMDIDMVGMGPYIEHQDTPLAPYDNTLVSRKERFDLALKMVATLRLLMPDINIAAATALQAIDKMGREKAVMVGANILMPNITPGKYRNDYLLYDDKPCTDENAEECSSCLEARLKMVDHVVGFDEWGDSKHFAKKNNA